MLPLNLVAGECQPLKDVRDCLAIADVTPLANFVIVQDCFFTRGEYQQLLYQALSGLPGLEIVPPCDITLMPAILKPQERWTGKQVNSGFTRAKLRAQKQVSQPALP